MMVQNFAWWGTDPKNMLIVPTEPVISLSSNGNYTIFVTSGGKLFVGNYNGEDKGSLRQIELPNKCVKDATIYKGQIVFVTSSGEVYNQNFSEGSDICMWPVVEPKKTCSHGKEEKGKKVRISSVSAGCEHILFLSNDGEIWVQGKGPALGLVTNKTEHEITNPARVDFFRGRKVLQIEAGAYFTAALVEALPDLSKENHDDGESVSDLDSYVSSCMLCQKEFGNKDVDKDNESYMKCPLGLPVSTECSTPELKSALSPTHSNINIDGRSSRSSCLHDDDDYVCCSNDDHAITSGEISCIGTSVNSPIENSIEFNDIKGYKKEGSCGFEIIDCNIDNKQGIGGSSLFKNADAARMFISRQLSWMTSENLVEPNDGVEKERTHYYPIDTAAELLKENVASAANLVATSVRSVSDKVGQLSRHFNSVECADSGENAIPVLDFTDDCVCKLSIVIPQKPESVRCNTLPRRKSNEFMNKRTHFRSRSGTISFAKYSKSESLILSRSSEQVEKMKNLIIESGTKLLNTEVWAWGSARKGQLGLGDTTHRSTPTNITFLNHNGITKLVVGSHHTAVLSITGQVVSFLIAEMEYLCLNHAFSEKIVKSLLDLESSTTTVNYPANASKLNSAKTLLFKAFIEITSFVASSINDTVDDCSSDVSTVLPIINQVLEYKSIYSTYIKLLCDVLSVGGLTLSTKESNNLVSKHLAAFSTLVSNNKTAKELYSYILLRPLERIFEYEEFIVDLASNSKCYYSPFTLDKIKIAQSHWNQLASIAKKQKCEAEETRNYWETCGIKIIEALAIPSRRLLQDSKTSAINVRHALRFSYHTFVLFTDVLVHIQYSTFTTYSLSTIWVDSLSVPSNTQNNIQITMPEESLSLVCPSAVEKNNWLRALQEAINLAVLSVEDTESIACKAAPLVRSASYTFTKHPVYKDATYTGQWLHGKPHGQGIMVWPDERKYHGQFWQGVYEGVGLLEVPILNGKTVHEGLWKKGKLEGKGVIRYTNKDVYVGHLHEGLPHGHGELKKGRISSCAASVFTGEWYAGAKCGYGVLDDLGQGEKYLGMWQNDNRQGPGMVVTMNGIYYEGTFNQNKLTGVGLMIYEDGTHFEGELGPGGSFAGKGTLCYPCGDYIDGTFSGSWTEGIKINGTLHKGVPHGFSEHMKTSSIGKFGVPAKQKWVAVFRHCEEQLGITEDGIATTKVWENMASAIDKELQQATRLGKQVVCLDGMDSIPELSDRMASGLYKYICNYLLKAFHSQFHPLGQLLHSLIDAFRATYGGVVAHPRLLTYAVEEVSSFTSRLYGIVQILFPSLPKEGDTFIIDSEEGDTEEIVVAASSLIHPLLLPHLYSPLSTLYVLHWHKEDEEYWQRLLKWNKQSDIALMTFLGVDVKFWLPMGGSLVECGKSLSVLKDSHFSDSIETLQMLSTSFTPHDKLQIILHTFQKVNQAVSSKLGESFLLSMDDLFPVFQYVVVRSRIQHLGAEIHLIEDLMDTYLQHGELGIMFTTLKACYYQIQNEKTAFLG